MKIFCAVLTLLALSLPAHAQQAVEELGDFNYWSAYSFQKDGNKICYMVTSPIKQTGNVKGRKDTFMVVTNTPSEGTYDIVNLQAGYNYKKGSKIAVNIGKDAFTMSPFEDMAWLKDGDDKLVAAMIKGNTAVVQATAENGVKTVDTYSLVGFTKARKAMTKACPQK